LRILKISNLGRPYDDDLPPLVALATVRGIFDFSILEKFLHRAPKIRLAIFAASPGWLPSAMMLRLHLLILDLQRSHSLRALAPRPKPVYERLASIEEGASRGEWCDHDAEKQIRNAMHLVSVPSGQSLAAVLSEIRERQSLAAELDGQNQGEQRQ
jgi:hypothetical protein